jgi:hypothetical protein
MSDEKHQSIELCTNEAHMASISGDMAVRGAIERASDIAQNVAHRSDWDHWSGDWDKWQDSHGK